MTKRNYSKCRKGLTMVDTPKGAAFIDDADYALMLASARRAAGPEPKRKRDRAAWLRRVYSRVEAEAAAWEE